MVKTASKHSRTTKLNKQHPKKLPLDQRIVLKFVGAPGYAAIFTAWVMVGGIAAIVLYQLTANAPSTPFYSSEPLRPVEGQISVASFILVLALTLLMWAIAIRWTAQILNWFERRLHMSRDNVLVLKMVLLALGWVQVSYILAKLEPDFGSVAYFISAGVIALGTVSFLLEYKLINRWRG